MIIVYRSGVSGAKTVARPSEPASKPEESMLGSKFLSKIICGLFFLLSASGYCFGEELSVTLFDVGQADSILVQTAGKRVLIDAGETAAQVKNILKSKNIANLDLIIATHPHSDHIGGMKNVVENTAFKVYMDNGYPHTSSTYAKLMEAVENKAARGEARYMTARQGQRLNFGPEAYFEVLWPDDVGFKDTRSDINANSVILKLTHKNVCFAFMADAEAETEAKVAKAIGSCQVLKVSHHGSPHSSTDELINTLKPKIALISTGLGNKHGHPGPATIEKLEKIGAKIYRTDLMGEVTAISDGANVRVVTAHEPLKLVKLNVNLADLKALKELPGVGDKTAQAILDYRAENGDFKTIEDVYNATKDKKRIDKIIPYITVEGGSSTGIVEQPQTQPDSVAAAPQNNGFDFQSSTSPAPSNMDAAPVAPAAQPGDSAGKVNINVADEGTLAFMPGMDTRKAKAAVADREANGPFKSCSDIGRVKGIGKKTVEKIVPVCTVEGAINVAPQNVRVIQTPAPVAAQPAAQPAAQNSAASASGAININAADAAALAAMPGMTAKRAASAVADREANGPFKSCEDLARVNGIGKKTVEKLLSICAVE